MDGGLSNAVELVQLIREEHGDYFCVAVAAYPECHTECWNHTGLPPSQQARQLDLMRVKAKVDAGADFIITQFFYDLPQYLQWEAEARAVGIHVPILPGYMPIQTYKGFKKFSDWCKTSVPAQVRADLAAIQDDDLAVKKYGVKLAVATCRELMARGCKTLHFYTMNLSKSVSEILDELGFLPKAHERRMPWVESGASGTDAGRAQEDVRPIFWVNRAASYISRTKHWDEYPNGRWGSRQSPAFGELSDYYLGAKKTIKDRQEMWGTPQSTADVAAVFIKYVDGVIPQLPWTETGMSTESGLIGHQLRWLNQHGFLTINSQPRANGVPSDHPVLGWGGAGGRVFQKAYVEFFCSDESLQGLVAMAGRHPSLTFHAVNRAGKEVSNSSAVEPNAVTWGVFPDKEVQQPTVVDPQAFRAWAPEAFELWSSQWLSLYKPRKVKGSDELQDSPEAAKAREVLGGIVDGWWLVNVVDNDYTSPSADVFSVFHELVTASLDKHALQQRCLDLDSQQAHLVEQNSALNAALKRLSGELTAALKRAAVAEAEVASLHTQLSILQSLPTVSLPPLPMRGALPALASQPATLPEVGADAGLHLGAASGLVPAPTAALPASSAPHKTATEVTAAPTRAPKIEPTPASSPAPSPAPAAAGAAAVQDVSKAGSKRRHFGLEGF